MAASVSPSVTEVGAELQAWRVRVLNSLLGTTSIAATVVVVNSLVHAIQDPTLWPQTVPFLFAYAILLVLTLVRRLDFRIRVWGLLVIGYAVGALYLAILGLLGNGMIFLLALPALGAILLGFRSGLVMGGLSLLIYASFTLLAHLGMMADWLIIKDNSLELSQWLSQGLSFALLLVALVLIQSLFSRAQTRALESAHRSADELRSAHEQLQVRSEQLARYARLLEAATDISHETTSLLEPQQLLERSVALMVGRLNLNQVVVYLRDESTGEIAQAAVAGDRDRAPLAAPPAVVHVIEDKLSRPHLSPAEGTEAARATIPLHVGEQVLGALHIDLSGMTALTDQEIAVLHTMADQLAIALQNARLFAEAQASLLELDALYRHYTMEAWQGFTGRSRGMARYSLEPDDVPQETWQALLRKARTEGVPATATVDGEDGRYLLAVPVKLRNLPVGALGFHRPVSAGPWQPGEVAAVEAVSERLALAADNLRLLEDTQRRAAHERVISEVTARMRETLDMDTVLQTAIREIGDALGISEVEVRLRPGEPNGAGHKGRGEVGP